MKTKNTLLESERSRIALLSLLEDQKSAQEALQKREKHSQSLLHLSQKLELSQTYTEVLSAVHDEIKLTLGYQSSWVYLMTEDKKFFKALTAGGPMSETVLSEAGTTTLTIQGDRMLEEIAEAKEIVVVEDARTDERTNKEIVARIGNRTIANMPIILRNKHLGTLGTGTFGDEGIRIPTIQEREFLAAIAGSIAVTLDRIQLLNYRKFAEEALRESEEKYRFLADNTSDILALLDFNFNYTYISPSVLRQRGYTVDEARNQKLQENTTPETLKKAYQLLDEELANEASGTADPNRTRSLELEQYCKDGTTIWVDVSLSFVRDQQGKAIGIFAVSRDITERKKAEKQLRLSEEKFRKAFLTSPDAVAIIQLEDGKCCAVNKGFINFTGYAEDEIVGKKTTEINLWYDSNDRRLLVERLISNGIVQNHESVFRSKNGELKNGLVSASIIEIEGVSHIISITRDITERKRSEQKIIEAQMMLQRIINLLPIRVFWKDIDSKYLGCNEIFAKDAGKKNCEELIGKDDYQLGWKEQAELYRTDDRNVIVSGIPKLDFEEPQTKPGGEKIWLKTSKVPLTDINGNTIGILGTYEDITEPKQAENNLRNVNERLSVLIETIPYSIFLKDGESRWLVTNESAKKLFQLHDLDWKGKTEQELANAHPAFRAAHEVCLAHDEKAWNARTLSIFEEFIQHKDGTIHQYEVRKVPLFEPDGTRKALVIVGADVTERKQKEEALLKLKKAVDNSGEIIFMTDKEGVFTYINPEFTKIYGFNAEEIIGKVTPRILKSGLQEERHYKQFWEVILQGKEVKKEIINKRKDGKLINVECSTTPIFDEKKSIIGFLGIH